MRRRLPWPGLLGLIVMFLFVPQLATLFGFGVTAIEEGYSTVRGAVSAELLPDLGGALIALGAVTWLGWGHLVWKEPLRTRAWVWVVPVVLIAASLAAVDYARLSASGPALVLALLGSTLATGVSEELLFRGITLQAMRDKHRELAAATLTAVLFGATHLINALVLGSGAVPQAVLATLFGYLLYLSRRVSGGLLVPIVMHWVYDFSIFSAQVGPDPQPTELSDAGLALLLIVLVLFIVVVAAHRVIAPRPVPDLPGQNS